MSNKSGWALAGVVVVVALVLGMSRLGAQRPPEVVEPEPPGGGGAGPGGIGLFEMPGRFVVAKTTADDVILLDTATGKLYKASLKKDVKDYKDLPKVGGMVPPPPFIDPPKKDEAPKDKRPIKDKG